jgi:hypothetical protein
MDGSAQVEELALASMAQSPRSAREVALRRV